MDNGIHNTIEHTREPLIAYTAVQIAIALGVLPRSVRKTLREFPSNTVIFVKGIQTAVWSVDALPGEYRQRLTEIAARRGFRSVHALLDEATTQWQPAVPLAEAHPRDVEKAAKLMKALRRPLNVMNEAGMSERNLEAIGVEEYRREFGHSISARHWYRLFKRTVDRDRGNGAWRRLDIYLSDSARPAARREPAAASADSEFADTLQTLCTGLSSPINPRAEERALLWVHAFEALEDGLAQGASERDAKRAVLNVLTRNAPFLARGERAMRRAFERKFAAWRKSDGHVSSVEDKRPLTSGRFRRPVLNEDELTRLRHRAAFECGGRTAQAWREMIEAGELRLEIVQHYGSGFARKSDVPKNIMRQVRYDVPLLLDYHHGPNRARTRGPWVQREHTGYNAGDVYQGDDLTLPVYWFDEGNPMEPMRGQFLALVDCRSMFILGWVLISEKAYNSRDILRLLSHVHDDYGLPRRFLYFENGAWSARLLCGPRSGDFDFVPWSETEMGLRRFGLRIIHARRAQAKIIERIFGALQNRMERLLGYCGRDERHDRYERVQKQVQQVKSGRVDAREVFMGKQELARELEDLVSVYNREPQEGDILRGLSPWQAFQQFYGDVPLKRFDATTRYMLASYRKEMTVGPNGISFTVGKERFTYKNENTGRLRGRKVIAYFDPDCPDFLSVTVPDLSEEVPFVVERAAIAPAMDPDSPLLEKALQQNAAHQAYANRLFRNVRKDFPEDFQRRMLTPMETTPEEERLGANIGEQVADREAAAADESSRVNTGRRAVAALGVPFADTTDRRRDQQAAAPALQDWLRSMKPAAKQPSGVSR